jgi:hypothetical protein
MPSVLAHLVDHQSLQQFTAAVLGQDAQFNEGVILIDGETSESVESDFRLLVRSAGYW